jgi:CheY-like chemotaxis protein
MPEGINEERPVVKTILCIDDSEVDTFLAEQFLVSERIAEEVIQCHDASKALGLLKELSRIKSMPDRIILDINMPGMDGFQFLEEYENAFTDHWEQSRIIMCSSSLNTEDRDKAFSYGSVVAFLTKPINSISRDKVVSAVRTFVPI